MTDNCPDATMPQEIAYARVIPFPRAALHLRPSELEFRPRIPWTRIALTLALVLGLAAAATANHTSMTQHDERQHEGATR